MLEEQIIFENLNDSIILSKIYDYFNNPTLVELLTTNQIPVPFGINVLVQMSIYNICNPETLVGLCKSKYTAQHTADLLYKLAELDVIDYYSDLFRVKYLPDKLLLEELKNSIFVLPMIIEPEEITNNKDTGYVCITGSHIIMGDKINRHNKEICLDHINRLNKIPLTINKEVISFMKNKWKTKRTDTKEDLQKKDKALTLFNNQCKSVYNKLNKFEKMYLTHKYDKRGRTYCVGYHINYMGNEYQKSVVELHKQELINVN
jgi:DNA-directed RNA polymerase